ncbi:uncharacterized protein F21D5.5 isoform X2 [Orussus abietinus]|uniref:uncharacterized protein F21D5.5 isoform X2 n=1 Tax=Orussus abietinus TaxID=222816 RepID=UPI0006268AB6|nr:uncharacterized protein F21D5.5 isoform X2 [Orussus abietinus]
MSVRSKSCYIYSDDPSLSAVYLPDNTPVFVGRTIETKITDTKCSRNQVRLCASYTDHKVFVQQVGSRPSGLNGLKTQKGEKITAKNGDILEILYGKYPYRIEFNPPPEEKCEDTRRKKRTLESSTESIENGENESRHSKKSKINPSYSGSDKESTEGVSCTEEDMDDAVDKETISTILSKIKNNSGTKNPGDASCSKDIDDTDDTEDIATREPAKEKWEDFDNRSLLIYTSEGVEHRSKIAAYDMDGTLIKTMSGLVFPKDCNDWQLLYSDVPGKLKKLHAEGYKIVIFTNQGSLGLGKLKPSDFKVKIERVVKKIGVPMQVFIAPGKSIYRKPVTGMWDVLVNHKNGGVPVDKDKSFYVGDAAGRDKNWAPNKKKDHSSADRLLALNLGLKFQTPEEHFLGQKPAPYKMPDFDPKALNEIDSICDPPEAKIISSKQEVIIMVGGPGSGKSHTVRTYLDNYIHINRDTLGSWQKCVSMMDQSLTQGKSVVIDNTNPDPETRQKYVKVAQMHNVPVRCFVMKTDTEHSKHNNKFRELTDSTHDKVSDIIINSYTKKYVEPSLEEGFAEIVYVNFVPKFQTDEDRRLYEMFLLEK